MLKKYQHSDFDLLESWVTDEDILFQFAGSDFSYPITKTQLIGYQVKYPGRFFYIGYTEEGVAFAFGEIITMESPWPRLGRILIGNPSERGKGLGKYFVSMLIGECKKEFNPSLIDLFVWDQNIPAIKCYEKLGFKFTGDKSFHLFHRDKAFNICKMSLEISK